MTLKNNNNKIHFQHFLLQNRKIHQHSSTNEKKGKNGAHQKKKKL